jgi:hypothetical protein
MADYYRRTTMGFLFGPPSNGGGGFMRRLKLLVGLALLALGLGMAWRQRSDVPFAPAPEIVTRPEISGFVGSWTNGNAAIYIRADGSGAFAPDGMAVVNFRPNYTGDEFSFRTRLKSRTWRLRFIRTGDTGRLVGIQEGFAPAAPLVFAPATRTEREKQHAADDARRRSEAESMLVPTDFGTFSRVTNY